MDLPAVTAMKISMIGTGYVGAVTELPDISTSKGNSIAVTYIDQ